MRKVQGHLIVWYDLVTDPRLSDGALRLYLLLCMHAQERLPVPIEAIARKLGISKSTVHRRLQQLNDLKLIIRTSNEIRIPGPEQYLEGLEKETK